MGNEWMKTCPPNAVCMAPFLLSGLSRGSMLFSECGSAPRLRMRLSRRGCEFFWIPQDRTRHLVTLIVVGHHLSGPHRGLSERVTAGEPVRLIAWFGSGWSGGG